MTQEEVAGLMSMQRWQGVVQSGRKGVVLEGIVLFQGLSK